MKIYVIKIAVRGFTPMVWRRLRIAADISLAALHFINNRLFATGPLSR